MQNMPIAIFRGDDTDALGYQTIVGTIRTDLDLTGCKAVFKYLSFSVEFDPIPEDKKLTVIIPASETSKFPPGLGYASLRVYDAEGKLCTFSNRIMVFVATKTPMFGNVEFEVDFNVRPELEPLKIFVGPNPDDFDEYRGFLEKVIDRASAQKYGLAILLDAIDSDLGANDGVAATPVAVKAAYAAIIEKLTDDYYTKDETDDAIDRVAAYYITYDAAGNPFPTYAALANAQTVYSGGAVRVPTRNDYCVVLADETHEGSEYRYIYAVAEGQTTGSWQPQYPVEGVMTVDQTVTKNSQNPVASSGIWSAIWGALSALPTGFSSLYDWCVSQLAGKASIADATLTPIYSDTPTFSEWDVEPATATYNGQTLTLVVFDKVFISDHYWCVSNAVGSTPIAVRPYDPTATSLTFTMPSEFSPRFVTATRTRTDILGYRLGTDEQTNPNRDKPLASEAEAEALRTGKVPTSRTINGKALSSDVMLTGADIPVDTTQGAQKINAAVAGKQDALSAQQLANIAAVPNKLDKSGGTADDLLICGSDEAIKFDDDVLYLYSKINGTWVAQHVWDLRTSQDGIVAFTADIPYNRITITTGQLQDHAVQKVTLNAATTTLALPALTDLTGKVSDFGIGMVNGYAPSNTPTAASFSLAGTIGTDYNIIVPEGEDWSEMSALAAGEMAVYYFTLSAFQINNKPTWEVMKKVVELVPVPVAP